MSYESDVDVRNATFNIGTDGLRSVEPRTTAHVLRFPVRLPPAGVPTETLDVGQAGFVTVQGRTCLRVEMTSRRKGAPKSVRVRSVVYFYPVAGEIVRAESLQNLGGLSGQTHNVIELVRTGTRGSQMTELKIHRDAKELPFTLWCDPPGGRGVRGEDLRTFDQSRRTVRVTQR